MDNTAFIIRSETYLFLKYLVNAPESFQEDGFSVKKAEFETDLWLEGKNTGNLVAEMMIKHVPYLMQKLTGVLTESGIKKAAPIVIAKDSNPKLKELGDKLNIFREILSNKDNCSALESQKTYDYQLHQLTKGIQTILKIVDKNATNSFVYKSFDDVIQAQELFVQIAQNLYVSADKMDKNLQHDFYECMITLLKRGELDLAAMSFDDSLSSKHLAMKHKVALQYQNLLYQLLSLVFDSLEQQGPHDIHKNFIEFFLAYSYFRIPEFRTRLLNVLSITRSEVFLDEGKTIEIESVLIDWDKDFYNHLKEQPKYLVNKELLGRTLQKNWEAKFKQKSLLFFYFVVDWCDYVRAALVVKNISWDNIIGYTTIVYNFIERMNAKEVVSYPDILINASLSLLHNPNILDLLVKTLITNTK